MTSTSIKDASAVGLLGGLSVLFELTARSVNEEAFSDAVKLGLKTAVVAAPPAGIAVLAIEKSGPQRGRNYAFENTLFIGGGATLGLAVLAGLGSLAWDIFRA